MQNLTVILIKLFHSFSFLLHFLPEKFGDLKNNHYLCTVLNLDFVRNVRFDNLDFVRNVGFDNLDFVKKRNVNNLDFVNDEAEDIRQTVRMETAAQG